MSNFRPTPSATSPERATAFSWDAPVPRGACWLLALAPAVLLLAVVFLAAFW